MAANNDKAKEFINKLLQSSKDIKNIVNIWCEKRRIPPEKGDMIKEFFISFMGNLAGSFLSESTKGQDIKSFLNGLKDNMEEEQYLKQLENLKKIIVREEPSSKNIQIISGKDIIVMISYNTKKMKKEYCWKNYLLTNQIEVFVKSNLKKSTFDIKTQTKSIRILEGKKESTDGCTGVYLFDPFFNCVKLEIRKKKENSSFKGHFQIESETIQTFHHIQDTDEENWISESDFSFDDPINKLLSFIFQKENGSPQEQEIIKDFFQQQRLKLIRGLLYNTKDTFKEIPLRKWSNQLWAHLERIKTSQKKRAEMQQVQEQQNEKQQCFKIGNSHKILRYVYYMANNLNDQGIFILNRDIPLLNPDLVDRAITFIETKLQIQNLFPRLRQYFISFCLTKALKIQKPGILFYGPPGTGKTRLTEYLAELIGMNPVSIGLSSSQFMEDLVGQAKGTLSSYLRRSQLSPHLICCLSIDEIDAIIGDRRRKQSKSVQAISMFLSFLGGNKNIENLFVFGSTNFINEIDYAILRRFPNFYVALPSLKDRRRIIEIVLPKLKEIYVNFLSRMTPNFSGAALKRVCYKLRPLIFDKNQYEKIQIQKLLQIVQSVGTQFKIKFGSETYPHLYPSVNKLITMDIMRSAFHNFVIIEKSKDRDNNIKFKIVFAKDEMQWREKTLKPFLQIKEINLHLHFDQNSSPFQFIYSWIQKSLSRSKPSVQIIRANSQFFASQYHKRYEKPTLLVVNIQSQQSLTYNVFLNQPQQNLYVIYFVQSIAGRVVFERSRRQICFQQKLYSGRVIVDLTTKNQSSMILERIQTQKCPIKIEKKFLLQKRVSYSKDVLPEVVEFIMSKQVDDIQMIDGQSMSDNSALQDQAYRNIIISKVDEARQYANSAIIIDTSSMISLKRDVPYSQNSQNGQNASMSIAQPVIYKQIIQQMKRFAQFNEESKRLIAIIVENEQILKMLKRDVKWPNSPEEQKEIFEEAQQQRKLEAAKKQVRICQKCSLFYTREQNQQQKTCKVHYGYFINEQNFRMERHLTLERARQNQYSMNLGIQNDDQKKKYRYSCCLGDIDSEPCQNFYHHSTVYQDQNSLDTPQQMANQKENQ